MSIHIGDKVVRSLPEEVSDLRKRIDELEEPKHLYLHCLQIGIKNDYSESCTTFILSKRNETYDFDSLIEYLNDNEFVDANHIYPAWGDYSGDLVNGIFNEDGDIHAVSFSNGTTSSVIEVIEDKVIRLF